MIYAEVAPSDIQIDCFTPYKRQIPSGPTQAIESAGATAFARAARLLNRHFRQIMLCS
jgi:glyoxylate/hydroxypyruvate reductase A